MDIITSAHSRWICAALTAAIALVLAVNPRSPRVRRAIWAALIAAGLLNVYLLLPKRIAHTNLAHYYLGAKYALPYFDFYKLTTAAEAKPQAGYRDLRMPDRVFRADPREQRLYYIGQLRAGGVTLPPSAGLAELEALFRSSGLLEKEAEVILASSLPPGRVGPFRADVARMDIYTGDFGFNGSPFSVLVRQLDPAIHIPFGPAVCHVNLALQFLALGLIALLAARVLNGDGESALIIAALVLASWDFTGWGLNGLVSAGWMLPAAVALWGIQRRNPWVAGLAIAWAGLNKLFPFVMVLPLGIIVVRAASRGRDQPAADGRTAARTLLFCAIAAAALAAASRLTGLSWADFLEKIRAQFHAAGYLNNSIGVSAVLLNLWIRKSPALIVPQVAVLFAVVWVFWMRADETWWERLPRGLVVLLACMAWLTQTWFNYYSVVGLLLVPSLFRRNRALALALLAAFALSYALPDYGHRYPPLLHWVPIAKILPHLLLPLTALGLEIREIAATQPGPAAADPLSRWLYRNHAVVLAAAAVLSVAALGGELYRVHGAMLRSQLAAAALAEGRTQDAAGAYRRVLETEPDASGASYNLACALEAQGKLDEAAAYYRKAADLEPANAPARNNLALLLLRKGERQGALALLEEAARAVPFDEEYQFNLGLALASLGHTNQAIARLRTALDIDPGLEPAKEQLKRLQRTRGR